MGEAEIQARKSKIMSEAQITNAHSISSDRRKLVSAASFMIQTESILLSLPKDIPTDDETTKASKENQRQIFRSLVLQTRDKYRSDLVEFSHGSEAIYLVQNDHLEFSMLGARLNRKLNNFKLKSKPRGGYRGRGRFSPEYQNTGYQNRQTNNGGNNDSAALLVQALQQLPLISQNEFEI